MNKTAIWAIIILMSVALLGTAVIQVLWFKSSISLEENRFDNNVFDALNRAEERLSAKEDEAPMEVLKYFNSPGSILNYKDQAIFMQETGIVRPTILKDYKHLGDVLMKNDAVIELLRPMDQWTRQRTLMEILSMMPTSKEIEERIDPSELFESVKSELSNYNIDINFQLGVFSHNTQSFVILNDNFVISLNEDEPNATDAGFELNRTLFNSEYHVDLFRDDLQGSPGILKVHFPTKQTWLWASLLPTLLGTVLFTGLILFCFSYTIHVIFRQKKVSEMKTDFINNMTHEFKTPIATISLAADSIKSPMVMGNDQKVSRFADIIKQENKRMLGQVEKVLQMARIDKKEFQLKVTDIDMHQIIEQAVEHASLQIQKRDGVLLKELKADKTIIEGDQTHLSSIIYNLLDNANKYSPEKPRITIHTRNVGNGIELIVEDEGVGMSKDAKKHIFEKFYRVPTGNLHNVKGFGLGLSYVKAIVDAHHGKVVVQSEPGKGSSFILYFPFKHNKNFAA